MKITEFLNTSYTAYHTAANVCKILSENGFTELSLGGKWNIKPDGKYFVVRNGSSVIAFRAGANKVFNICQSHTDSPSFKVKGNSAFVSDGLRRLNVEKYGGGLLYTYFDRPLKIAGRVFAETERGAEQRLVTSEYNVVIPSLAIHHNPTANESFSVNVQTDALPIFGQSDVDLYSSLTDGKVLDADLYAVPSSEAFYAGANREFLCSARLDNLTSVYAGVNAIVNCEPSDIAVVACLDNEETGSGTRQGHPSFVRQTLEALADAIGMNGAELRFAYENGLGLSVDNAHACHPAHPEKSDPLTHVKMNGGVVIKHHTNYATDGLSAAVFKKLCIQAGIPYQDYYNNSSVRCGSTLGLITSAELGLRMCDIGIGELGMHSACETCGAQDVEIMEKCLTAFLNAEITGACGKIDVNLRKK